MRGKRVTDENLSELIQCFNFVDDPRVIGRSRHLLVDVLVLSICATLCGAQSCIEIEEFGQQKYDWLKKFLELPAGVPSHDTIARILSIVDPSEMETAFTNWVRSILGDGKTKSISVDGKSLKGTQRQFPKHPLHLVNVYCHETGLTLGQSEATGRGVGETGAALQCLSSLEIKNVTVMADAGLATNQITSQVRERGGHYIVPIKKNQRHSLAELERIFSREKKKIKSSKTKEFSHGRHEVRLSEVLSSSFSSLHFIEQWRDVKTLIKITRTRGKKDNRFVLQKTSDDGKQVYEINKNETRQSTEIVYYISSRELTAKEAQSEIRRHWGIETKLHWALDVAFSEDDWRVRTKTLARSLAVIRKIALNLIRQSNTTGSIRVRIKRAAWNDQFLEQLVLGK